MFLESSDSKSNERELADALASNRDEDLFIARRPIAKKAGNGNSVDPT